MINEPLPAIAEEMIVEHSGLTIGEMSEKGSVLLVFLRFFGCSFCREAINDLADQRAKIEATGTTIIMVHMSPDPKIAETYFKRFKLSPVNHISDPSCRYYQAFGLTKATPTQLAGLQNFIRGFQSAILAGRGAGTPSDLVGDGFQMPGIFLLHNQAIINKYIHRFAYDRPNYAEFVQ